MNEFVRHEVDIASIPHLLTSRVLGFRDSPEYRAMRDDELKIAGVVLSAFAEYLSRLHQQQMLSQTDQVIRESISSAHAALETLVSTPGTAVRSLVTDEVFETVERTLGVMKNFEDCLKPHALALYKTWIGHV